MCCHKSYNGSKFLTLSVLCSALLNFLLSGMHLLIFKPNYCKVSPWHDNANYLKYYVTMHQPFQINTSHLNMQQLMRPP